MPFTINDVIQYDKNLSAGIIQPLNAQLRGNTPTQKFDSLFRSIGAAGDVRPLLNWMSDVKKPENHDDDGKCTILKTAGEKEMYRHWELICSHIYQGLYTWCTHCEAVLKREGFEAYVYHLLQEDRLIDHKILAAFARDQASLLFNGSTALKWQDIRISISYMSEMLEWVNFIDDITDKNRSSEALRNLGYFRDTYNRLAVTLVDSFSAWAKSFSDSKNLTAEEKIVVLNTLQRDTPQYFKQKIDPILLEEDLPAVLVDLTQKYACSRFIDIFWEYGEKFNELNRKLTDI